MVSLKDNTSRACLIALLQLGDQAITVSQSRSEALCNLQNFTSPPVSIPKPCAILYQCYKKLAFTLSIVSQDLIFSPLLLTELTFISRNAEFVQFSV